MKFGFVSVPLTCHEKALSLEGLAMKCMLVEGGGK